MKTRDELSMELERLATNLPRMMTFYHPLDLADAIEASCRLLMQGCSRPDRAFLEGRLADLLIAADLMRDDRVVRIATPPFRERRKQPWGLHAPRERRRAERGTQAMVRKHPPAEAGRVAADMVLH